MAFELLNKTYSMARPDLDPGVIDSTISLAVGRAKDKHPDFERFQPGIDFLSTVFFTDHQKMPLDDYIETLYCAVKHADFTRDWRAQLRKPPASSPVQ
jgi:hypothetical protein